MLPFSGLHPDRSAFKGAQTGFTSRFIVLARFFQWQLPLFSLTNIIGTRNCNASITPPPRYVARWLASHLTGCERGVPMKDDRLRVARLCRVLTQRSLLGASRFLRLGWCVDSNARPVRFLGGLSALARGYIHGVTSFSNPGRASRLFFILLFRPVIV